MNFTMESPGSNGSGEPLRVLVVDHVGVLRSVRERYVRLVRQTSVELTLLSPTAWVESCSLVPYEPRESEPFATMLGRVTWPGHETQSFFLTGIIRAFRQSRPQAILMMEEAFSLFALQVLILQRIFAPSAPILFYTCFITPYAENNYRPRWFFRWLGRFMLKRCAEGLCINDKAVRELERAGFTDARSLFFGVDEEVFKPLNRRESRAKLGIQQDVELFLYAGRLLKLKGIQDLIEAFTRLSAERPGHNLQLIILGSGDYGDELLEMVTRLGVTDRVLFRSYVPLDEVRVFMSAANAFVLPSRTEWVEQFGRVIAEAMLTETTVIGSTSGEIPRAIGEAGFIFPAGDVDALKHTMAYVLDDPEEADRRKELGRQKALREYSLSAFVDGLADVIEDVTGRKIRTATVTHVE